MKILFKLCFFSLLTCSSILAGAQTVTLDYFFNRETRKDKQGKEIRFHYLWNEHAMSGFSILGDVFKKQGFKLDSLETAPTLANLKGSSVYLIVDPDRPKENPKPNYIEPKDIAEISAWVKQGGILVMFANDSANVELPHFNKLAGAFGMHFTNEMQNHVIDDAHFEDGAIVIKNNPVFKTAGKIFMKDVCSIDTKNGAKPVLKNAAGATVIASAKFGKGNVIAIADPWLYDEYVNGRLPKEMGFENDKAAFDLVLWLKTLSKK
ncbi:hypothetical protein ASE74_13690 [Pedobacter sp. Leaf216]|uniref:DUF4350 domain-containing protein n=1 Tax=Pedobacter sp. Leaf216 TaxID=1735684 RepID=UPI0006FFEED4|nr:DUF4350 domain-containing protein [Pedobacter sp. Leaf216]KQM78549.1 hypothetical protein ASE74_13690 [Pedobacter sp. Leaf216]